MWPQTGEGVPVPIKPVSAAGGPIFSIACLCPQWQVLNKAKNHIQELEQTLDNLLKVKGNRSYVPPPPPSQGKAGWFSIENRKIGLNQVNE